MCHLVIDQENIRQDICHLVSDLSPNKCLWRCSNVGLFFSFLEMASGMIPGLVLLRELEVFVKLLSVLHKWNEKICDGMSRTWNGNGDVRSQIWTGGVGPITVNILTNWIGPNSKAWISNTASWIGWSLVYMLKRVGERTLPCSKPFFCSLYLLHSLFSFT